MKILFVKPNNLADHIQPSLGLAILAQLVRDRHDVEFYDCIKEDIRPEEFADRVIAGRREDVDLICVQCYTFDIRNVKSILRSLRRQFPGITLMLGGAHITTSPQESMEDFGDLVDYAIAGEAELGFPEFVEALASNDLSGFPKIPGLMWRGSDGALNMNEQELVPEERLDELGTIAWDLLQPQTYPEAQHGAFYEQFPIAPIITTRGCPYKCTFCSAPQMSGSALRHHSPEFVIDQITMLHRDYGIREIHIVDDNFTMDLPYAKEVLRRIIDAKLGISLAMPNGIRMDRLDDELLSLMKQAGMYMVTIAIENGNDRLLKLMRKGTTVQRIRDCVARIKKHGFDVAAFFILGYPTETMEEMENTIRFSLDLDIQRANYFTYLPLPGTESYQKLREQGDLDDVDWEKFYFMSAAYVPDGMNRQELLEKKRQAFRRFYLRPRIFWYNISKIKSIRHFGFLFNRFSHWVLMNPEKELVS